MKKETGKKIMQAVEKIVTIGGTITASGVLISMAISRAKESEKRRETEEARKEWYESKRDWYNLDTEIRKRQYEEATGE